MTDWLPWHLFRRAIIMRRVAKINGYWWSCIHMVRIPNRTVPAVKISLSTVLRIILTAYLIQDRLNLASGSSSGMWETVALQCNSSSSSENESLWTSTLTLSGVQLSTTSPAFFTKIYHRLDSGAGMQHPVCLLQAELNGKFAHHAVCHLLTPTHRSVWTLLLQLLLTQHS